MMAAILAKYRNSILAAILAAILAGCMEMPTPPVSTATITETASPVPARTVTPSATPERIAVVKSTALWVHAEPDARSKVTGWLVAGDKVTILDCADNFCNIEQPFGYVWQGCLSDNPDGLGCSAK